MKEIKFEDGRTINVYSSDDIMNHKRPILIKIEGEEIGFPEYDYWIELSRIKTRSHLIAWIHHLLGKAWINNENLEQFIEQVCTYNNWKVYSDV
jgi:hypothetical protein